jgi:4-amino-4-deoxy-L-arabinose transferase-like glycosyltransferase
MDKNRNITALGIIFLATGVTFLALGLAKRQTAYWAMVPTFIALGVGFLMKPRLPRQPLWED